MANLVLQQKEILNLYDAELIFKIMVGNYQKEPKPDKVKVLSNIFKVITTTVQEENLGTKVLI
jgi:predicted phosphatase